MCVMAMDSTADEAPGSENEGYREGKSVGGLAGYAVLQFMPFLLYSAKPTEPLFICVMVSTPADPPPDYGKLTQQTLPRPW